jgi:hypothetical protein
MLDPERGLVFFGTGENYSRPTTDTSDAIFAVDAKTGARALGSPVHRRGCVQHRLRHSRRPAQLPRAARTGLRFRRTAYFVERR